MTKQEYLSAIRGKIRKMPADDINKFMDYYSEMIDDRMEDGLSEEDAVADMDAPDDVVDQILADMPLTKLVKEKIKPSHRLKAWEIILLILGSPIWAPLLLTAIVLVIAMAVVIWHFSCPSMRSYSRWQLQVSVGCWELFHFCYTECSGCPFHAWSCICWNRTCDPVHRSRKACYDRHFQAVQGIRQWN